MASNALSKTQRGILKDTRQPILLAIGANLESLAGPPLTTIRRTLEDLNKDGIRLLKASSLYETPCFPPGAGPDFVNAAVEVETRLPPVELLARLHEIESRYGRVREFRWAGRTLDIDLLACGNLTLPSPEVLRSWIDLDPEKQKSSTPKELLLPHPRIQDRGFVLIPLAEIAPDWRHPVLGKTVRQMSEALPDAETAEIHRISP